MKKSDKEALDVMLWLEEERLKDQENARQKRLQQEPIPNIYTWPTHTASGVEITEELKKRILDWGPVHPSHPDHEHEDCCK